MDLLSCSENSCDLRSRARKLRIRVIKRFAKGIVCNEKAQRKKFLIPGDDRNSDYKHSIKFNNITPFENLFFILTFFNILWQAERYIYFWLKSRNVSLPSTRFGVATEYKSDVYPLFLFVSVAFESPLSVLSYYAENFIVGSFNDGQDGSRVFSLYIILS